MIQAINFGKLDFSLHLVCTNHDFMIKKCRHGFRDRPHVFLAQKPDHDHERPREGPHIRNLIGKKLDLALALLRSPLPILGIDLWNCHGPSRKEESGRDQSHMTSAVSGGARCPNKQTRSLISATVTRGEQVQKSHIFADFICEGFQSRKGAPPCPSLPWPSMLPSMEPLFALIKFTSGDRSRNLAIIFGEMLLLGGRKKGGRDRMPIHSPSVTCPSPVS